MKMKTYKLGRIEIRIKPKRKKTNINEEFIIGTNKEFDKIRKSIFGVQSHFSQLDMTVEKQIFELEKRIKTLEKAVGYLKEIVVKLTGKNGN